jgi:hypothetical protein
MKNAKMVTMLITLFAVSGLSADRYYRDGYYRDGVVGGTVDAVDTAATGTVDAADTVLGGIFGGGHERREERRERREDRRQEREDRRYDRRNN